MIPSIDKPEIQDLPRMTERLSFIYLEECTITRQDGAILARNSRGSVEIPASSLSVLMLGPGTSVTHRAMELLGDCGTAVLWVGEQGVRFYAYGRSMTTSSALLTTQAKLASNVRTRVSVARKMYAMRFPGEDVSGLTMQQLRGREGSRVRTAYSEMSKKTGVPWSGRSYDATDYTKSDAVNQALSMANSCLYGVVTSVIVAMGCSTGLGFVHTGHEKSFVYDIADLYKVELSVPVAFEVASSESNNITSAVRRRMRDLIVEKHLLERIVHDIKYLLSDEEVDETEEGVNMLWDGDGIVEGGVSYHSEERLR